MATNIFESGWPAEWIRDETNSSAYGAFFFVFLQGTVKQLINFGENEGTVIRTAQCGTFLLCLTSLGKARIFDLSKR